MHYSDNSPYILGRELKREGQGRNFKNQNDFSPCLLLVFLYLNIYRIEYILEWNLLEKSVKRHFIVLFPIHTAGVPHIFVLYLGPNPGISFYRKSKIIIERKPNYEIGWFI